MKALLLPAVLLSFVAAAPVPPENEARRLARIYGEAAGVTEGHTFKLDRDALKITLPERPKLDDRMQLDGAACVWRDWTGDFTLTVRLATETPRPGAWMNNQMGLVVRSDEETHYLLGREIRFEGPDDRREHFEMLYRHPCGVRTGMSFEKPLGETASLRLVRRGNDLTAGHSRDGKKWTEFYPDRVDLKAKVKVGVFVRNVRGGSFTAVFDQYVLAEAKR